jgi:hypothetical protein
MYFGTLLAHSPAKNRRIVPNVAIKLIVYLVTEPIVICGGLSWDCFAALAMTPLENRREESPGVVPLIPASF